MSKWDKLIQKILSLSRDLRFDELRKVLESLGYTMTTPSGGSSHHSFRRPGYPRITIPKNDPVKIDYVREVRDAIEEAADDDENA